MPVIDAVRLKRFKQIAAQHCQSALQMGRPAFSWK
jgi:hypothetical protein